MRLTSFVVAVAGSVAACSAFGQAQPTWRAMPGLDGEGRVLLVTSGAEAWGNGAPALWIRLAPLVKQGVHQLEIMDGQTGLPSVAPDLVAALSRGDGKAMFVHVNHQAKQALLHAFEDGTEVASYTGEPDAGFETAPETPGAPNRR